MPRRGAGRPGPAAPARDQVTRLPGTSNLLVRYINQGRLDGSQPHLSPRRATRLLLTRPDRLAGGQQETLARVEAACPEMTALADRIRGFAGMLAPDPGIATRLQDWITAARSAGLQLYASYLLDSYSDARDDRSSSASRGVSSND